MAVGRSAASRSDAIRRASGIAPREALAEPEAPALTTVEPVVAMFLLADFDAKTDEVTKERRAKLVTWADRGLAGLETCLGEHAFVTGEALAPLARASGAAECAA